MEYETNWNGDRIVASEWELEENFDEYLNEVFGTVRIAGLLFDTAEVLKLADEVAYRQEFLAWLDAFDWNETK